MFLPPILTFTPAITPSSDTAAMLVVPPPTSIIKHGLLSDMGIPSPNAVRIGDSTQVILYTPAPFKAFSYFFISSFSSPHGTDNTTRGRKLNFLSVILLRKFSSITVAFFISAICPSITGNTIFVVSAVLPISFLASVPTAFTDTLSPLAKATTLGSKSTTPAPS